ncbi:MAG: amino acid adenylation domain-containing protein, partial [Bryobacterales bacterium]|nr:amino acid adenylation domain-containing protein [Bryobacterales bacterium]
SWSYREVNERANQVAHTLRTRLALQVEDRVGVLMERGEWRVIALLGILKAGGAYFPVSSTCPDERLRFLLDDSGCRAVVGDDAGVRRVNAVRAGVAVDVEECRTGPVHNPPAVCGAANLAYLMYTSGSTGRPKGVLIEHGGFVNMILDQIRSFGVTPADRVLQFASSSFDASLSEIFMALAAGAHLVLIGEQTRRDANLFQACMRTQRISVVTLPPSYLRALEQPEFPDLRVLITAGEPADAADVRHYSTRLRYFNAYGPTEASVCASFHEVRPQDTGSAVIPIGRPVSNSGIRLLDRRLRPVPMGVPGEICIQGPGLARGYLNRPELTQSQFVRAPSGGGARLYRTGDLGCLREDGQIVCLGRTDTQVKFHGFRVELGEIESVLREYPGIGQAAVTLYTTPMDAGKLVAYYVAGSPLDPGKLRDHLSRRLPAHMIPSAMIPVREIPRTTAGKVDRAALAAPAEALAGTAGPVNDVQRAIASVFQEVLGRADIGIHDSFLNLGGDSLKAILAVGRLRRSGLNLNLRDLSGLGSIAMLAAAVRECPPAAAAAAGPAPLTPIQHWYFKEHSRAHWHRLSHAILLRAADGIEEVPLRAAVAALWQHHDALRMRYQVEDGGAVIQTIGPATASPAPRPEGTRSRLGNDTEPRASASGRIESCGQRPGPGFETLDLRLESSAWGRLATHANALHAGFSLDTGPLFKAALCRMQDADHALLVAHHLVVDGVSWRILLEDLSDAYQQARNGHPIALPPKTSSYADWANALTAWSCSESLLGEKAYWSAVESSRLDPIPTDFPVTPHHYGETDVLTVNVPAALDGGDAESAVQAVLLTAVARTLRQWTGCESTRVLLAGHGRIPLADVDVSRTVGWFTANYPVVARAAEAADVAGQVAATRRMLASVPTQGVGFGVLKYLTPARMTTGLVLAGEPEIGLNYIGRIDRKPAGAFALSDRLPGASAGEIERTQKLEFDAMLTEASLIVSVRYCPKLHRSATIAGICGWFEEELTRAWAAAMAGSSGRLELQKK